MLSRIAIANATGPPNWWFHWNPKISQPVPRFAKYFKNSPLAATTPFLAKSTAQRKRMAGPC
jgi:hypothetical protein